MLGAPALLAVPTMYLFGFLAWSTHSMSMGLGPLPLSIPQYLAPGFVILAIMGVAGFVYLGFLIVSAKRIPIYGRAEPAWVVMILRPLFAGLSLTLVILLALLLPQPMHHLFDLGDMGLVRIVVLGYGVLLGTFLLAVFISWYLHGAVATFREGGPRPPEDGRNRGQWQHHTILRETPSMAAIALVALVAFSFVLHPFMHPEYGGANDRLAMLDLDPDDFSTETLSRLWPEWEPGSEAVVRTPSVRVMFSNSEVMLVRPAHEDPHRGALFDFPRPLVAAIIWLD